MTRSQTRALTEPLSAFHVGGIEIDDEGAGMGQVLCSRFADHRGLIELPALAVLFDHCGGVPFHRVLSDPESGTIQARLSISTHGRIAVGERLAARSRVVMHDDAWGSTAVEIRDEAGALRCAGSARNVRIGRALIGDRPSAETAGAAPYCDDDAAIELPEPIPADLSGRTIVDEIAGSWRSPGPLTEMLNARVEIVGDGPGAGIRFTATTEEWMGNHFRTMHGGVIATIAGQAASFAGQLHAAAGREYSLGDMAIGFYRSPAVDGTDVVVDVVPIKVGRRIASFEATMTSSDDVLLSRATVDVHYH